MCGFFVWGCLALVAAAGVAQAQELRNVPPTPRDFAWQWPLRVEPGEDLVRLKLNPETYARLWRDDLSDLVVFNGADEPVPMATLGGLLDPDGKVMAPAAPLDVPLFRIPRLSGRNTGERLRLIVTERGDGRLERIDTRLESEAPPVAAPDLLLDLSALHAPVRGLLLEFAAEAEPLNARVDVFGSSDLSRWTRLASAQALVWLREDGLKLERRRIEFADTHLPYLRILRTDSDAALPVTRVQALRGRPPEVPELRLEQIEISNGRTEPRSSGYVFAVDGPYPVERLSVTLAERNAAASVIIESRARPDLPWRERARGSVFRLSGSSGNVDSAAFEIAPVRDRQWRVRAEPMQSRSPTLTLGYRPDEFAFLTQGEGPFRLAAGSARAQRTAFPLRDVLDKLRQTRGEGWLPGLVHVGRGAELAGGAALAPRPDASGSPTPMQWLLWGLLLLGAFSVVMMVLKLLRQSAIDSGD